MKIVLAAMLRTAVSIAENEKARTGVLVEVFELMRKASAIISLDTDKSDLADTSNEEAVLPTVVAHKVYKAVAGMEKVLQ